MKTKRPTWGLPAFVFIYARVLSLHFAGASPGRLLLPNIIVGVICGRLLKSVLYSVLPWLPLSRLPIFPYIPYKAYWIIAIRDRPFVNTNDTNWEVQVQKFWTLKLWRQLSALVSAQPPIRRGFLRLLFGAESSLHTIFSFGVREREKERTRTRAVFLFSCGAQWLLITHQVARAARYSIYFYFWRAHQFYTTQSLVCCRFGLVFGPEIGKRKRDITKSFSARLWRSPINTARRKGKKWKGLMAHFSYWRDLDHPTHAAHKHCVESPPT